MSKYSRPKLSYEYSALEPHIDTETMTIHHTKHHEAYVVGLNKISSAVPSDATLHQLLSGVMDNQALKPEDKDILIRFGGGHYNHSLFWEYLSDKSDVSHISEFLSERIKVDFGDLTNFQKQFDEASIKVFGSGWAWWVYDYETKKSSIMTTKDQVNPIMANPNLVCLLGLDVWEHAYYLKYQNKRAEYVQSFWNVVNWHTVSKIHDLIVLNGERLEITNDGYIKF